MKKWKNTIQSAQLALQDKNYDTAIALNEKALEIASYNIEENIQTDPHKTIASIMISHFNLAKIYIAIESYDLAYCLYQKCFSFIKKTSTNSSDKTIDFNVAICCAINKLKQEWNIFQKAYCEKIQNHHLIASYKFEQNLSHLLELNTTIH